MLTCFEKDPACKIPAYGTQAIFVQQIAEQYSCSQDYPTQPSEIGGISVTGTAGAIRIGRDKSPRRAYRKVRRRRVANQNAGSASTPATDRWSWKSAAIRAILAAATA